MASRNREGSMEPTNNLLLRPHMFLFPRPYAAVLAAFITAALMVLINLLIQHAGS